MSSKFFNSLQYGLENPAARGTGVAATKIWTGQGVPIGSDVQIAFPKEEFGVRADERRASVVQKEFNFTTICEHGIFQLLPIIFSCGLKGAITAAETTGGQSDYLWTFSPSSTAANAPDSATWELCNDTQAYEVPYCMVKEIRLSGSVNQDNTPSPVKIEADWFGQKLDTCTKTAGLSLPTPTGMNAHLAKLYLDTAWAGVGGTALTNLLRSWELTILTGNHPLHTGGANNYMASHAEGIITAMLSFTLEQGATANALLALQQAGTFRVARLEVIGPQIGSGGTHYLKFDVGGSLEELSLYGQEDRGDNLSTFTLHGHYNDTGAKTVACLVQTNSNAV